MCHLAPKFRGRPGKIGELEILHEVDPQQLGGPPGDIGVTGKIGVNLEGEGHHPHHRPVAVEAGLGVKGIVGQDGAVIRHKNFFKEPHQHQAQAVLDMGIPETGPFFQLRDKIPAPFDGPRHHLGKKGVEGGKGEQIRTRRALAPINIDDVTQRLEGIKGDAHGQNDVQHAPVGVEAHRSQERLE